MKTRYYFFLLLLLAALSVRAQRGRLFTTDRELPNSFINQVEQDGRGYVWMATWGGLLRYDGQQFVTFRDTDGGQHHLNSNYVNCLAVDGDGRLLVGTGHGVQRYDYAMQDFHTVRLCTVASDTLAEASIAAMAECAGGDVLLATIGYGVYRLPCGATVAREIEGFPFGGNIISLAEAPDGTLWGASDNCGVACLRGGKGRTYLTHDPQLLACNHVCIAADGTVYVGTYYDGIYRYDAASDQFRHIAATRGMNIMSLMARADGTLLVGTDGDGAYILSPEDETLLRSDLSSTETDLTHAKVCALYTDGDGNLWAGLQQKGVLLQPRPTDGFDYVGWRSVGKNVIGSACVMSVCHDHEGVLWVGTDGDGIYAIDGAGRQLHHYGKDRVPATILCITEDADGQLYVGSYLQGAGRLDRHTGRYEQLDCTRTGGALHVYALQFAPDGTLWIGTLGDGLKHLDRTTGHLREWRMKGGADLHTNALPNNWVRTIQLSRDGRQLYVGMSPGLACLDTERGDFLRAWGVNNISEHRQVQRIIENADGTLWAATEKGLQLIAARGDVLAEYTTANGLPDDAVTSIELDGDGQLWVSTCRGMARINPVTQQCTRFFATDGLQGNEFSERASVAVADSLLVFGGKNGITLIRPARLRLDTARRPVVSLTEFIVAGRQATPSLRSGRYQVVDTARGDAHRFQLAWQDNSFTIGLSAMEYAAPEGIRYAYSLNGEPWVTLPEGTHQFSLSHLPAGTYHFQVKAVRSTGQESDIHEFDVIVHPAWYASPLAYCLYLLLIVAAVAWYLRHRRRQQQLQLRLQEHIHAEQLDEARMELMKAQARQAEAHARQAEAHAQLLENAMPDTPARSESPDEKLLSRIIACINQNASNPDYNVEMIASDVGLSRVHLYRKMKELTQQSPSEFIGNVRLKLAAQYLSARRQSIEEVAYACGFNSPASFSRKFKSFYGKSPTEYMREHMA